MDVYCGFSLITHLKCQVGSQVQLWCFKKSVCRSRKGVVAGMVWHGFVMLAAADWGYWCPLMLRKFFESGGRCLVRVTLHSLCFFLFFFVFFPSLDGKLTHFFVFVSCLSPCPSSFTASELHRFPVWSHPHFILLLCSESRRHRLH